MSLGRTLVSIVLVVILAGLLVAAADVRNPIENLRNRNDGGNRPNRIPDSSRPGPWYGGGSGGDSGVRNQWWLNRNNDNNNSEDCPSWFRIYGSTCYKYWRYFQNLDPWTARDIVHNSVPWS